MVLTDAEFSYSALYEKVNDNPFCRGRGTHSCVSSNGCSTAPTFVLS